MEVGVEVSIRCAALSKLPGPSAGSRASPSPSVQVMALLQKRIISRCNQLGKPVLITRIVDTVRPLAEAGWACEKGGKLSRPKRARSLLVPSRQAPLSAAIGLQRETGHCCLGLVRGRMPAPPSIPPSK